MNKVVKLKKILLVILLIAIIVILGIVYYHSGTTEQIIISIKENDFILSKNGYSDVILDNTDLKNGIELKNKSNYVVFADQWILLPQKTKLLKPNRIEGKDYIYFNIKNKNSFKFSKHKVRLLSENISNYSSFGKLSSNKHLYLVVADYIEPPKDRLIKVDPYGKVSYYKQTISSANSFKTMKSSKGKIRYGYFRDSESAKDITHANSYIILNENYEVLDEISGSDIKNKYVNMHDVLYIDDNHYIFVSYYISVHSKKVLSYVIEEIDNGKTKWQFDTADYPEFYETSYFTEYEKSLNRQSEAPINYMNFNSFTLDPKDNNLLISSRNQNAIFKLNRKTGKIMWILGGNNDEFGLTKDQKFFYQHSISIEKDGSILMYDNGNYKKNSRIIEIKIDEKNKKIVDYKSYDLKDVYTNKYGTVEEVDKDKGLYLISYGLGVYSGKHDIEEVNLKTGKVNFWLDFIEYNVKSVHLGD